MHVHNTTHVISPAVYYAAKSCGVPVVQTIHNYRMIYPAGTLFRDGRICESFSSGDFKPRYNITVTAAVGFRRLLLCST